MVAAVGLDFAGVDGVLKEPDIGFEKSADAVKISEC